MIFSDRNIFLIGNKREVNDFRYLFDWSESAPFINVDEESYLEILNNEIDNDNEKKNIYIICTYNTIEIVDYLVKKGLERKLNFYVSEELLELLDFPIEEVSKRKNIFVWGTGNDATSFVPYFNTLYPNVFIEGFIDSDKNKQGLEYSNRRIYSPEEIIKVENIYIIIATTKYYEEVKEYLKRNEKVENDDFVHMSLINRNASELARKVLHAKRRTNFVCTRPFKFAEIGFNGSITTCCGIVGLIEKTSSLFYSSFNTVWHSNVLKVIRLSMINGSYVFCNPLKCEYLYDCRNCIIDETNVDYGNYKTKEDDYPRTVQFSFDTSCNLHCESCRDEVYIVKGEKANYLSRFAERMNRELLPNIKRIKFAGGETCVSDIYKQIIWADSNIDEIAILSNGSLMNGKYIENIAKKYKKIDIVISIDGAKKETAEKLRRGLNFDIWKKNIKELSILRKQGIINLLGFTFVVQRDNYKEMKQFAEMCFEYNADYIRFSRLMQWGCFTEEEYKYKSLLYTDGRPLEELQQIVSDSIFSDKRVKLFGWIEWFV